jgi:hypothetical protein
MFSASAMMKALQEFKVKANEPVPPLKDRLLVEAWHGTILSELVCNADQQSSDDDEEADEIAHAEEEDISEGDNDDSDDEVPDALSSSSEDSHSEPEDEASQVGRHSFVKYVTP